MNLLPRLQSHLQYSEREAKGKRKINGWKRKDEKKCVCVGGGGGGWWKEVVS